MSRTEPTTTLTATDSRMLSRTRRSTLTSVSSVGDPLHSANNSTLHLPSFPAERPVEDFISSDAWLEHVRHHPAPPDLRRALEFFVCTLEEYQQSSKPPRLTNAAAQIPHSTGGILYDGNEVVYSSHPMRAARAFASRVSNLALQAELQSRGRSLRKRLCKQSRALSDPPTFSPCNANTDSCISSSLSAGPLGYMYSPVSARPEEFESLRLDFGIQYKKRRPLTAWLFNPSLLWEDGAPLTMLLEQISQISTSNALLKRLVKKVRNWCRRNRD